MEGIVGGERRTSEIAEVYLLGSHVQHGSRGSLISVAEWGSPSLDHGSNNNNNININAENENESNETTELLGEKGGPTTSRRRRANSNSSSAGGNCDGTSFLNEIPAILVTLLINFMSAIPFGVSYFPLGWSNDYNDNDNSGENNEGFGDGIAGPFPLPGKEALGIRMFLMASITGQIAMALASNFKSPVSAQLIENVPFYHALAGIVIAEQGYGPEALSTLFFLFGLSSFSTGLLFYGLGRSGLGRSVHYFPSHVLVGFIGGIGVFIGVSSIGVLTGEELRYTPEGISRLFSDFGQLAPSLALEIVLRILIVVLTDETGKQRFGLLVPFFFLSIVPMFYVGLFFCGIGMDDATERGYFFPAASPEESTTSQASGGDPQTFSLWKGIFDGHVLDIFRVVDIHTVSWKAVFHSLGTVVGMSCFSVINVPINIPALANTCKVEVDMNNELMAHGYSNMLAGLLGGIQNVMTYSISVLFYKSGGNSMAAQIALIVGTSLFFVVGVVIIPYIPKCMAGTLLLHIGVDLFIEGVCDSIKEYDKIEYGGILVITVVMTFLGMTPALIAGIIVAMTTYALQSMQNLDPIFNITTAATLRSSAWTRPPEALAILDSSSSGRERIIVIQLQGNLFFGNVVDMGDAIKEALAREKPMIAILDFTLVVGMDTSAAQSVNKLKNAMNQTFGVTTNIFVMGTHRGYFPCEHGLAKLILKEEGMEHQIEDNPPKIIIPKNQVCVDFDEALVFAEDVLITFEDPTILTKESSLVHFLEQRSDEGLTLEEEKDLATHYLQNLIRPDPLRNEKEDAIRFLSYFTREVYSKTQVVWRQSDISDSAKLILSGTLVASLGGRSGFREEIPRGVVIGELGLLEGVDRLSEVVCESDRAIVYSLNRETWEHLVRDDPALARILDHIAIRYLSHRVQHVSNRIYETRCLPV